MSQDNVEIVRQAMAANRSGPPDVTADAAVALTDPDVEFASRLGSVEGATYRGHAGLRRYFTDLADAFQEWRNEIRAIEELGPDMVVTEMMFKATSRSGVDLELRGTAVFRLSDGKIVRALVHNSREQALEAAGLSE